MWFSRISLKLFLIYAVLNLLPALIFLNLIAVWQERQLQSELEQRLRSAVEIFASQLTAAALTGDNARLQERVQAVGEVTGIRFTLISRDGAVLAESFPVSGDMQNHLHRPEIQMAQKSGVGIVTRLSKTLQTELVYVAIPVREGDEVLAYARAAYRLDVLRDDIAELRKYIWLFGASAAAVALLLTWFVAGRIIQPLGDLTAAAEAIAKGNYQTPVLVRRRDELGRLGEAFQHMQQELEQQVRQLRENSQNLETVLATMNEGVLVVDAEQRILLANEASRRLLGIEVARLRGRPFLEVARHRAVSEAISEALRVETAFETDCETTGGNRRVLALRATRLPGSPPPGVLLVLHDVTDVRRLDSMRREFAANVSHELKTPLSSIKAYAETLRLGALYDTENNVHFVTRIEEQADRLHQLILDLLHLSRVEAGRQAFDIKVVSLGEMVEAVEAGHRRVAEAKNLELRIEPPAQPLLIRADEDGVRTILDNLISNALHYTPAGGEVVVRWRAERTMAVLEVADTGIGIAPRDQKRVFERFFRVDKARSREMGGTGLGLAIVKHLAQAFGGEVGLQSELGVGSTFQARFPLVVDAAVKPAAAIADAAHHNN
jgi:two-component system phosphate regulon sensor histidine kinase PhoR